MLGILDAAEIMKSGTVAIPALPSFANDDEMAINTVYHTIEFLHTIRDTTKLSTVRLVASNNDQLQKMQAAMKTFIEKRK